MAFDRDDDAGTTKALEDALPEIAEGEGPRVIDMIDKAPPGSNVESVRDALVGPNDRMPRLAEAGAISGFAANLPVPG
jgi:hypothetical protein